MTARKPSAETRRSDSGSEGAPSALSSDAAYWKIRDALLDGAFAPDALLTEQALADRYSVSRTPVREALRRLEQDGLVVRTERGMQVRARSPEEILDIYEVRIVLEIKAAELAATRHSELDGVRLGHLRRAVEVTAVSDPVATAKVNRAFHRGIWVASHNDSLIHLLERLDLHLSRYAGTTLTFPGRKEQADEEHAAILDAVLRHDASAAAEAAGAHFSAARAIRLALWAEGHEGI